MSEVRLGIDVACRADHRASLADERGEFIWSSWKFRTTTADLERLWAKIPDGASVTVILEPTRNAWVPLSAWLQSRGATVILVPPEQSADLRDYYNKHTKTDRLDSRVLARLPLLHPEGLRGIDNLGPAESLRRAVRHRFSLVKRRSAASLRLDALVELLGPGWADSLGSATASKTALVILEKYADPRALKRLGHARLAALLIRSSAGLWREDKADELLAMANETLALWSCGGIDFTELAHDIASEVRVLRQLDDEITAADKRIAVLYDEADPKGIVRFGARARARPLCRHLGQRGRLQPLRQPGRRPLLHRLCAQDRPVRTGGGTQGHHQGRRRRPAPGPLHGSRSRSPHRPHARPALLPTGHGRGQAPQLGAVLGLGRPHHPDRRLLAQRRALPTAR